jgi:hypothetical protein
MALIRNFDLIFRNFRIEPPSSSPSHIPTELLRLLHRRIHYMSVLNSLRNILFGVKYSILSKSIFNICEIWTAGQATRCIRFSPYTFIVPTLQKTQVHLSNIILLSLPVSSSQNTPLNMVRKIRTFLFFCLLRYRRGAMIMNQCMINHHSSKSVCTIMTFWNVLI